MTRLGFTTRPDKTGFTLIEAVMTLMIVGVMLAALLNTIGSARASRYLTEQRSHAELLADELIDEIKALPYEDPDQTVSGIGTEPGEGLVTSNRLAYDDIDDYDNWIGTPPISTDGSAIAGATDLTRTVQVRYARPADINIDDPTDQGIKRIVVRVKRGQVLLAKRVILRTHGRLEPDEEIEE